MKKGIVTLIGVAGFAAAASAQSNGTFLIESSNEVNNAKKSTTISVYATWVGALHIFGGANYDLNAGDGTFSGAQKHVTGIGSSPGFAFENNVFGAALGQTHIPFIGEVGNPDNPILIATYLWSTSDLTPRTVPVVTLSTLTFLVAEWGDPSLPIPGAAPPGYTGPWAWGGALTELFPADFKPGAGSIIVTPAPSALALLGLGGLVAMRRRRYSVATRRRR